jgi:hypothetical protein
MYCKQWKKNPKGNIMSTIGKANLIIEHQGTDKSLPQHVSITLISDALILNWMNVISLAIIKMMIQPVLTLALFK